MVDLAVEAGALVGVVHLASGNAADDIYAARLIVKNN